MKLAKRDWATASGSHFIEYRVTHGADFVVASYLLVERKPKWGRAHIARFLRSARRTLRIRAEEKSERGVDKASRAGYTGIE